MTDRTPYKKIKNQLRRKKRTKRWKKGEKKKHTLLILILHGNPRLLGIIIARFYPRITIDLVIIHLNGWFGGLKLNNTVLLVNQPGGCCVSGSNSLYVDRGSGPWSSSLTNVDFDVEIFYIEKQSTVRVEWAHEARRAFSKFGSQKGVTVILWILVCVMAF